MARPVELPPTRIDQALEPRELPPFRFDDAAEPIAHVAEVEGLVGGVDHFGDVAPVSFAVEHGLVDDQVFGTEDVDAVFAEIHAAAAVHQTQVQRVVGEEGIDRGAFPEDARLAVALDKGVDRGLVEIDPERVRDPGFEHRVFVGAVENLRCQEPGEAREGGLPGAPRGTDALWPCDA